MLVRIDHNLPLPAILNDDRDDLVPEFSGVNSGAGALVAADSKLIESFISSKMEAVCELGEDEDFTYTVCFDRCVQQFGL